MYNISKKLISSLSENNICYCHWKSNLLLNEALDGYDDLDLLVKKTDKISFEYQLKKLNFKEASNKNLNIKSVHHFYGYDKESGNILHLHVYYEIKTGPSWIKSIRFNFEEYVLSNLVRHKSGVMIPKKHIELVFFVIRIMMKYTSFNEFLIISREKFRTEKEIRYLINDIDKQKLTIFLKNYFPKINLKRLYNYIKIIKSDNYIKKIFYAQILKFHVRKYIYNKFYLNYLKNIFQIIYRVLNKLIFKDKKDLKSGGAFIVIAGLDATGKTTIINDLNNWLGKNFTVKTAHFGKPPSTILTLPFNLLIKSLRKKISINSELRTSTNSITQNTSFIYVLRQLVLAFDRYVYVKKIYRYKSLGKIVLCDRYKSENFGVMDSMKLNPKNYSGLKKYLSKMENNLYYSMPIPDIIFKLSVDVETAVKRNAARIKKGKESEEFIRLRHNQNQKLSYTSELFFDINTNYEYPEVLSKIKDSLWKNI